MGVPFYSGNAFNRYTNLDNIEWSIIRYLINSETKFANNLWKILKYDTEDCLLKENVSKKERAKLVYIDNGDSTNCRVFMEPFTDDSWTERSSHLHIYVGDVEPENHLVSKVNIVFETITHNKITNIIGDATSEDLSMVNPAEFDDDENPIILYKNRETVMLKCVLAELNGMFVNGVGVMQFNLTHNGNDKSKQKLWNGKTYYGHETIMSTMLSGTSEDSECGF